MGWASCLFAPVRLFGRKFKCSLCPGHKQTSAFWANWHCFCAPFFLQINIDFHTKNDISQNISEPTLSCFDAAQSSIYCLMAKDSFPRFLRSEVYKELVKKYQDRNQKRWLPFLWGKTLRLLGIDNVSHCNSVQIIIHY